MKINVGSKKITIRKWKGKDKKAFLNALKSDTQESNSIIDALVYSCVEENVVLDIQELKYILSRIRAISLGDEFEIDLTCASCNTTSKHKFNITDVIKSEFGSIDEIVSGETHIKLGKIRNKDVYMKKVSEDEIFDLLLRVESFNGDDSFTLEELIAKFDDLDIDVLEDVLNQWEDNKFVVNDINEVVCPKCKNVELYSFDAIPNFFPETWLK